LGKEKPEMRSFSYTERKRKKQAAMERGIKGGIHQ